MELSSDVPGGPNILSSSHLFAAAGLIVLYFLIILPIKTFIKFRAFPSSSLCVPVVGDALVFRKLLTTDLDGLYENYLKNRSRVVVWMTQWFPFVLLRDPQDIKKLLSNREHLQKGMIYKVFDESIGTGSFNSPVDIWKKRRPHLEQAFHSKVMKTYPAVFNEVALNLLKVLEADDRCTGNAFNILPYFLFAAFNIIIHGAFGIDLDVMEYRDDPKFIRLIEDYEASSYMAEYRMMSPWYLVSDFLWSLTSYSKRFKIITARRHKLFGWLKRTRKEAAKLESEEKENDGPVHKNFMDMLLDREQKNPELGLTEKDFIFELISVFIAGTDASSKTMAFTMLYLGLDEKLQAKVHEELDQVFGTDEENIKVTEQALGKLVYLEACIKETLRMNPPVTLISRRVGSDLHLDDKTKIPKGTEVGILISAVHRNPEVYPEPDKYSPERFLPENSVGRDPYSWLPFSAGPRNCLGPKFALMEIKIVLAHLLHRYRVEAVDSRNKWKLRTSILVSLEGGWNVKLSERCSNNNNNNN